MSKEKTAMQELFMQLKLQLGNNKVSQMFDEVYWLAKEQEQIEKAFNEGYGRGGNIFFNEDEPEDGSEYYKSKYRGEG